MGTGGSGGLQGVLVVLLHRVPRGVGGVRVYADTSRRGYELCLGVWLGRMASAGHGHIPGAGRGVGAPVSAIKVVSARAVRLACWSKVPMPWRVLP